MTESHAPSARVELSGEYDTANAATITDSITRCLLMRPAVVEVDMAAVTFMDSTALGALIAARIACTSVGTKLVAIDCSGPVRRLLAITDTTRFFGVAA